MSHELEQLAQKCLNFNWKKLVKNSNELITHPHKNRHKFVGEGCLRQQAPFDKIAMPLKKKEKIQYWTAEISED